jgi:hypothetical protein
LGERKIPSTLFLDCGADSLFMDEDFAKRNAIPLVPLSHPITVILADRKTSSSGLITHETTLLQLTIGGHVETCKFYITRIPHHIILGLEWLKLHNPIVDWDSEVLKFNSNNCIPECCPDPVVVSSNSSVPLDYSSELSGAKTIDAKYEWSKNNWYDQTDITLEVNDNQSTSASPFIKPMLLHTDRTSTQRNKTPARSRALQRTSISYISAKAAQKALTKQETVTFGLGGYIQSNSDNSLSFLSIASISKEVYPFMETQTSSGNNPPEYIQREFSDVFSKSATEKLPEHSVFDCVIDVETDAAPVHGRVYNLTVPEDEAMQTWVKENLAKGFIVPSASPWGAPCFFVKKKDGSLRLCMDYRGLNKVTKKDKNPLPLISDLIRTLSRGKIFTCLDLRGAYNLLRIKEGHEDYTSFICKLGQFKFLVMPFGLTNAPPQFQAMMRSILRQHIGKFVVVYLDDIVIFDSDEGKHESHVRQVLEILRENKLYCKLEKCQFSVKQISYLGYIISHKGVKMDPVKVAAVINWPIPRNVKELRMFLGFSNFYRRLIYNYAGVTQPLTALLKKDSVFADGSFPTDAFQKLKQCFIESSVLKHPDDTKTFVVETDSSNFAIAGVLSQYDEGSILQPVAFYSRQMTPAERNYEIYDKELLAVHECLGQWRHFLQGAKFQFTVFCDHRNLQYFMTTKRLTERQARWSLFLNEFNFLITYRPGKQNLKADTLSRRPDYETPPVDHNIIRLLNPKKISNIQSLSYDAIHRRLGHIGDRILRRTVAASKDLVLTSKKTRGLCEDCLLGKISRPAIRDSSRSDLDLLEVIETDTQGPFPLRAFDGSNSNVKFIDAKSGYCKMETIPNMEAKSILNAFKRFQSRLERRTGSLIKNVRCDQGTEYMGEFLEFLENNGIVKQKGIAYSHQHPGKCERLHQTIMRLARAMLIDSKLPTMFYAEAQLTATYLYNRMIHGNDTITPYQHIYKRAPNYSHLRPFGTICYAFIPPELRNKLEPSGIRCRLIGYLDDDDTEECKGYKLLVEKTMEILCSNDVYFDEQTPIVQLPDKALYEEDEQGEDLFGDANYEKESTIEEELVTRRALRPRSKNGIVNSCHLCSQTFQNVPKNI